MGSIGAVFSSPSLPAPGRAVGAALDGQPAAWFAVWTKARHEAAAHRQLTQQGYDAFLPTISKWSRWKDRRRRIDWPLFQGYCFAHLRPADLRRARTCAGIAGIVAFAGAPAAIPDSEIESIRTLVASELQYDPCPLLAEGSRVEVVSGPLQGVVGTLVRKGAHARLVLSVDLIGQGVSVEVDAADVEAY